MNISGYNNKIRRILKLNKTLKPWVNLLYLVDIVVKSSNPLRTFILQWAEFFKYNPPTINYIVNNKNNQYG